MITKEEFLSGMNDFNKVAMFDPEIAHTLMDDLMCAALSDLGYHEGIEVFKKARKFYP